MKNIVPTALFIAIVALLWYARTTALLLFAALLLAIVLDAGSSAIQRGTRLSRVPALIILLAAFVCAAGAASWFGGGAILGQVTELKTTLPAAVDRVTTEFLRTVWGQWIASNVVNVSALPATITVVAQRLSGVVSGAFSGILGVAFVVFVAVCFAIEPSLYLSGFIRLFPSHRRNRVRAVILEIGESLRWWLIARLLSMIALALLVTAGLSLLRIPLAVVLGIIAGFLAFIPNIGAIVAALPALILAFAIAPERALAVLVMYWVCHFLDDFFIVPIAERKVVQLPPALTITSQVLLALPGGVLGIMLAAPLTACGIILTRRFWVEDVLEHRPAA
jgi:predicted PurR-regulated permease PerM